MTSGIALQTYNRQVRTESNRDAKGHTHTNNLGTIETVNNGYISPQASDYQDGCFHGPVDDRPYQEEAKADRNNNIAVVGMLGGFILMPLVSLVASTFFPFQGIQNHTSTSTSTGEHITPVITPVQSMGFN